MATRHTTAETTVTVQHVATPLGKERANGPHLGDLRAFVAECEDLPDDVRVHVDNGYLGESGRRDVTLRAIYRLPVVGAQTDEAQP